MDFKTAFEHYQAGNASNEERRLIEEEIEKQQLLAQLPDDQWEMPSAPADVPEIKTVRKNLRRRSIRIVLTSLVLVAAIILSMVYIAIPTLEKQYWDPTVRTYSEYESNLQFAMSAYSELFTPAQTVSGTMIDKTGFASYRVTVAMWENYGLRDTGYRTATVKKGELELPYGFWDYTAANIFERASYPTYDMGEDFDGRVRDRLSALPEYVEVLAAVSFPEDLSMAELDALQDELGDGYIWWAGIRNSEGTTQHYPLCGMKPYAGGYAWESVNEYYPCFNIQVENDTPETLETHFKSLLEFSRDYVAENGNMEPVNYQGTSYYDETLAYIEENGVYSYGAFIIGTPQLFLDLMDSGTASQVWPTDGWLNIS